MIQIGLHFTGQNEEIIRLNNKLFVELQSSKSSTGTSSKTNALVSHLFPIKTLATLLEIETQLEEEDDKLKRKQSLPKDNLSDAVVHYSSTLSRVLLERYYF